MSVKLTVAAAAFALSVATSASAMPVAKLDGATSNPQIEKAALVCNRWGRCWHAGRFWPRGYWAYGFGPGWHRHRPWVWRHRHWW
jgi:hypothetical protein